MVRPIRVLLIDTDPVLPTNRAVRAAIEKLAGQLGKAGVTVTRQSPLLPDFAATTRLYMRLLMSFLAGSFQPEAYAGAQAAAAKLSPDDISLGAERLRDQGVHAEQHAGTGDDDRIKDHGAETAGAERRRA